jgi:hypothetical protein
MNRWRKLRAISHSDRRLLWEAGFFLLLARVELIILPFARIVAGLGTRGRSPAGENAGEQVRRVRWAVEAVARHSPSPLTCLPQALAASWMLQARGHAPRMIYGVATDPAKGFSAHAWVELEGAPVVGHRAARGFTVLASFPRA